MRCVATWSFEPWLQNKGSVWKDTKAFLTCAKIAIEQIHDLYDKPVIYTDRLGVEVFTELTSKCTPIDTYTNVFDGVPLNLWAYPKLLTYNQQETSFFHFDLDFLLLHPIPPSYWKADIVIQNYEDLKPQHMREYYNLDQYGDQYHLPNVLRKNDLELIPAVNMGFVYFRDPVLAKFYSDLAIEFITENRSILQTDKAVHMCVIEQQILGNIIHDMRLKTMELINWKEPDDAWSQNFAHIFGKEKLTDHWSNVLNLAKQTGNMSNVDYIASMLDDRKSYEIN
jgi:hypothetical protein